VAEEGKVELLGFPSALTCPECRSLLYELKDPRLLRFRCRSGHALSAKSLRATFADASEEALWSAMRVWTEEAALTKRLAEEAGKTEAAEGAALSRRAARLMDFVGEMRSMLNAA
jgi:two-component system chemotaxis response regulator CheB